MRTPHLPPSSTRRALLRGAVTLALAAACSPAPDAPVTPLESSDAMTAHTHGGRDALTRDQRRAIARVRDATARFHDLAAAQAAGYTSQYPPGCAASPEGAQGIHYLNPALADSVVELRRPELVMYEPQRDGSLRLVGVDYVVPFAAWTGEEPPTLLGVPFMRLEPLGVWALHIWAWRPNPSGMFAMWNPNVSCALAE
jgi:hypothetical protein